MNKLLKSRKALSPVIASIILVAVTVAVSIAVAAWMGALTFSFTKTDQFNVASVVFKGTSPYTLINMSIQNTGSSSWTISTSPAQVNSFTNFTVAATGTANTLTAAATKTIYVTLTPPTSPANILTSGNQYSITILLTDGNKITYVARAP
jgi:flagellin-like protein